MTYPWLEGVETEFRTRLDSGRLPHALLLAGPPGTGKLELAESFVARLLCQDEDHPPCGQCRSCQLLAGGAHPDFRRLTFAESRKTGELRQEIVIEQVRDLISSLSLTNTVSRRKVALIHPAEAMNRHTVNALLKTLEEPPGDAVLILLSHDPARLPATIRSRCQRLAIRPPGVDAASAWLAERCGVEPEQARQALEAAAGSPLRAYRMLRDGTTEHYCRVLRTLDELRSGRIDAASAADDLEPVEPELLWPWLSLQAAHQLMDGGARQHNARSLSALQSLADRYRKLLSTPVRKDLLLRDWLIQWGRLSQ
jgi:DNA polymerase-3 subunit delta'